VSLYRLSAVRQPTPESVGCGGSLLPLATDIYVVAA
jgi:hypothetical protein